MMDKTDAIDDISGARRMSDYRGSHQAPDADYGAPLHDVEPMMPDYYAHPDWYDTGDDELDGQSRRSVLRSRNNPDAMVWIYRAVPGDVSTFNPGDWVTTSKAYARDHMAGEDGWHVMARRVKARELYTDGNSINEWAYWPAHENF